MCGQTMQTMTSLSRPRVPSRLLLMAGVFPTRNL
jgi:hypothetical protein